MTYYSIQDTYNRSFFYHTISIDLVISGVPLGEACSIVLRGATEQIIGEAERSLHDALCVLTSTVKETKTTFGGGMFKYIHHEIPYHQSIFARRFIFKEINHKYKLSDHQTYC